jgi:chemotaxis protein MotB
VANESNRPIIIKRKKSGGHHAHHGGAWKVAYADFVTAMMAFFLLMWLLNATSEKQRKGLADYFDSRIPISRQSGGGQGAFGGDSLTAGEELAHSGGGMAQILDGRAVTNGVNENDPQAAAQARAEAQALESVDRTLQSLGGESAVADAMLKHVRTRVTEDGLVIDVFDTEGGALFDPETAAPTPMMEALMGVVAEVTSLVSNDVAITGHVAPLGAADPGAAEGAWSLSAERAQMARRMLSAAGMDPDRVTEIAGRAGADPASADPDDPANRRIQITLKRDFPLR